MNLLKKSFSFLEKENQCESHAGRKLDCWEENEIYQRNYILARTFK